MAKELPKRLTIPSDVVRELYLKSGNQCAYPGCPSRIIEADGNLIGQICHIEAAMPDGERFNPDMTNEERAGFANLILLCYPHHRRTNDVAKYTVDTMKDMKAKHEAKFTDVIKLIRDSVTDHTEANVVRYPTSLAAVIAFRKWTLDGDQVAEMLASAQKFADTVHKLPIPLREFLVVVIRRCHDSGTIRAPKTTICEEVQAACSLTTAKMRDYISILDRLRFAFVEKDDEDQVFKIYLRWWPTDWDIWGDLRDFSEAAKRPLNSIIVDLRFDLLD